MRRRSRMQLSRSRTSPYIGIAAGLSVVIGVVVLDAADRSEDRLFAPLPHVVPAPDDNPASPEKIELGKLLFFDPRLSGDNQMSCATCHLPEKAYGDGLPRARGHQGNVLSRNTQTVLNVAFYDQLFWDGRADSLEEQSLGPITSPEEMHQDLDELVTELQSIPGYVERFRRVFGTDVTTAGITKALAAFQRTLVTSPSPFDRFLTGDESALPADAKAGLELFRGVAGCIRCHHGPLLSDGEYYRLGVSFDDVGREAVTDAPADRGRFRTPALRNVAETGPYMHDGSLATLSDVVQYYYRGVPKQSIEGLPLDVEPLEGQSFTEIPLLVAFLESLSGEIPIVDPPELPL